MEMQRVLFVLLNYCISVSNKTYLKPFNEKAMGEFPFALLASYICLTDNVKLIRSSCNVTYILCNFNQICLFLTDFN